MQVHTVEGGGGLRLHVREWGNPRGAAIFLIHGWSQNHLSWKHQFESDLADEFRLVALDNRGHGMSEKPLEAENYTDERLWADDVAAVISALGLERPVLAGWSYGGYIISDYVRAHGEGSIAGINYVAGAIMLNENLDHIGPGFVDNVGGATAEDLPTNIAAMRSFVRACSAEPMSEEAWEEALCYNIVVPPQVRGAMVLSRRMNSDDVLSKMTVPVLVTHGDRDTVVLPSMGEHVLEVCPTAEASWYEGVGHAPFLEDPERFNRELADFARRLNA
ncbi:MAG: alpha/beta hydrolase [Actinobacteria bacterium]|nr:alpha/beta hydrolase [Actinomycetota bacterium]PLS85966.1 MAG: alpha/beta hydrolase [Actinomycetota bacterium]